MGVFFVILNMLPLIFLLCEIINILFCVLSVSIMVFCALLSPFFQSGDSVLVCAVPSCVTELQNE